VDPELTLSCPSKLTAESGIDALTHAIEAYLATDYSVLVPDEKGILPYEGMNPMGDLYAEKCIHLVGKHFLAAIHEPENLEARAGMSLAATLGGLAFSNCGVALAHALEYPIGERYKCAHGAGNGIVLPEVMRFLEKARGDRLSKIGELLRVDALPETAIEEVSRLRREAGLPECLRDVGAEQSDLNDLAATSASLKRLMDLSPITPSEADLRRILEASF
jgi:alcohol dehydrogenase class IV